MKLDNIKHKNIGENKMTEVIKIKCEKCEIIFRTEHDILIGNLANCPKCGVLNTKCGFPTIKEMY